MEFSQENPMRAVIIGGGKGCRAIINLAQGGFLTELPIEILSVCDIDENAPGIIFASENGIETTTSMEEALSHRDIKLVIELTGSDEVLENIYRNIPRGIKVFDHTFARIFWDLANAQQEQARQLVEVTKMEVNIEKERFYLQSLFDNIPELVLVVDIDKRVIKINASFSRFIKISSNEAIGKTCPELFNDTVLHENCQKTVYLVDEVFRSNQPQSVIWKASTGDEKFWEVTFTPISNDQGETEQVLCTWHKITEKVMLQRMIESAELRFRSFIDSAHDWISIKDLEGRYMIVNKITAKSMRMEPEDFIGKRPEDILPSELSVMVKTHDQEVLDLDSYHTYNEKIPIDGKNHYFQTVRFPLKDYKDSTIGVCTIMRDVSKEANLKKQLVQAEKLSAVGKLAAGVAHEINNPLTGVLAYAEDLMEDMPEGDPRIDDLKVIVRETLRCRDIVRNLLDFARQENPRLEPLNPGDIVYQAFMLVDKLPQFRNINLEVKKDEFLPAIEGDPQQLQQVILNLLLNAAEAMEEKGWISIFIRYIQLDDKVVITVEDDGPGIPENLVDKIFEPFFSTKGTNGLGLVICWGIVERHQGTIEIEKSDIGGARFNIILPVYEQK